MLCDWNISRINEPSRVKMIQLIFKLNIDKPQLIINSCLFFFLSLECWFLIRIRSQSDCLIRKCLLQKIVGLGPGRVFNVHARWRLVWRRQWCVSAQPAHVYSCHFIWGVLFTLWAVSVWLHLTLFYFCHYQVGNPITILSYREWDDSLKKKINQEPRWDAAAVYFGGKKM